MILKGVQFLDYACFTKQFVALDTGVNLIVGKNNAGKTALLKGVAALAALPLAGWPQLSQDLQTFAGSLLGYCRNITPEPYYSVEILFGLQEEDKLPLMQSQDDWIRLAKDSEVLLVFKFWFKPSWSEDKVVFESADLRIPGYQDLPTLLSNENGIQILSYPLPKPDEPLPPAINTRSINPGGRHVTGIDRKTRFLPVPTIDNYFDGLASFAHARYVSPHRVVTPWVEIHTADILPENAVNLPVFLQTLHGRNRKAFQEIENFVISVFPEFEAVNPASERNQVRITLSRRDVDKDIPLTHCGTGVEQVLAIATFVKTAPHGAILAIDEPHSFLHPTAERQLIEFLKKDQRHRFLISTHSAVFMNSIEANKITHIDAAGKAYRAINVVPSLSRILHDLGYRNSDVLFYDALAIVEGRSDRTLLPILLELAGIKTDSLARIGFPILEGVPEKLHNLQTAISKFEKLVVALSQADLRRLYLLDGDRSPGDVSILKSMRSAGDQSPIAVKFLPRTEIEN
jgi:predicted ATPase